MSATESCGEAVATSASGQATSASRVWPRLPAGTCLIRSRVTSPVTVSAPFPVTGKLWWRAEQVVFDELADRPSTAGRSPGLVS